MSAPGGWEHDYSRNCPKCCGPCFDYPMEEEEETK